MDDGLQGPAEAGSVTFPVVGIGASAGGLAAFEEFFAGMPADSEPGMAFVLVQHLQPDHASILSELVGRYTSMVVREVEDGMVVQPNCTYIIPPGRDMALVDGALRLTEPASPRGRRLPIDFFFNSLAEAQGPRAIGIVLSGTGSDGTQGVRAIKAAGGLVMVQDVGEGDYDGMPKSALATGLVDHELPAVEMMARLLHHVEQWSETGEVAAEGVEPEEILPLTTICSVLLNHTGHDFSLYKPKTIRRRVERRMVACQMPTLAEYVDHLKVTSDEATALFQDLLIGVTSFFRDPGAFQAVADQVVSELVGERSERPVRVWCAGCSTGEEAYSIAMLLVERMDALKTRRPVQVFATDIDSRSIAKARSGLYPPDISADVSSERLARFFVPEPDGAGYRVRQEIRDLVVFSEQDLIRDPPFSRLDLICCRNLLIYMGAQLQQKIIPLFHYALKPNGWLFLGASEGVGDFDVLFEVTDRKAKLYRKLSVPGADRVTLPTFGSRRAGAAHGGAARRLAAVEESPAGFLRQVTERTLLTQYGAVGALVNAAGDIFYLHGRAGLFLEPSPGEAGVNNVVKMARDGLRSVLLAGLDQAVETSRPVSQTGVKVRANGHFITARLSINPVAVPSVDSADSAARTFFVVTLEEERLAPQTEGPEPPAGDHAGDGPGTESERERIEALEMQLRAQEDHLQSTTEELESSNEELRSTNEEMQSVNEELQSTNEELETSKEELQSLNEELATVNAELQATVADLSLANNDMNNLLAGTGIGTIFVDHQLNIMRFTPAASRVINLIPGDVGRPVSDIVSNLVDYDDLVQDIQGVLDTLVSQERFVRSRDDRAYAMRIQPYRTLDNVIEGAVISFVDSTDVVEARQLASRTTDMLRRTGEIARIGAWEMDTVSRQISYSPEALTVTGFDAESDHTLEELLSAIATDARPSVESEVADLIATGGEWSREVEVQLPGGGRAWWRLQGVGGGEDTTGRISGTVRDVTERKEVELALQGATSLSELAAAARDARDAMVVQDLEGGTLAWNGAASRLYGWSPEEARERSLNDRCPEDLRGAALSALFEWSESGLSAHRTRRLTESGGELEVDVVCWRLFDQQGRPSALATLERPATGGTP